MELCANKKDGGASLCGFKEQPEQRPQGLISEQRWWNQEVLHITGIFADTAKLTLGRVGCGWTSCDFTFLRGVFLRLPDIFEANGRLQREEVLEQPSSRVPSKTVNLEELLLFWR